MTTRPNLLFYCQHSLGLGHLVRSLALADGLAEYFNVVVLNGGRLPAGTVIPTGVELVNLVPLGHDEDAQLVSHDPAHTVDQAKVLRRTRILDTFAEQRPAVVLVELFPFGRKKFAFELIPLLDTLAAGGTARPHVVCSLRDILVNQRRDQAGHDERAARTANDHFDAVLVHTDPSFARLEDSFRPATALKVPVHYTGFVTVRPPPRNPSPGQQRIIVSAGGGMVGETLFRAAVQEHRLLHKRTGLTTTVVAGPFLPEAAWAWLQAQAVDSPALTVIRQVDDLAGEIAASAVSISQCGYNTTMDLLVAGTPAVVVPYAEGREDEQSRRAERLAQLGVVETIPAAAALTCGALGRAVERVRQRPTQRTTLDLDGRQTSARIIAALAGVAPAGPKLTP